MAKNTQPTGTPGMQVASHTNPQNLPLDAEGKRGWSNSLFDCFSDCGTCLTAACCPCIVYSQINSRIEHLTSHGTPHPSGGEAVSGSCIGYCLTLYCGIACILRTMQRGETRARYNVAGDGVTDFLTACCCHACGLVQESREIELEEGSYGK